MGAAQVIRVAVSEEDPAHLLEAVPEVLQCRSDPGGGGHGDAGIDDRRFRGGDEEGEAEAPQGDDGEDMPGVVISYSFLVPWLSDELLVVGLRDV